MTNADDNQHNDRIFPTAPRIGVGVVVIKDNKFVLVERQNHPGKGDWSIPGGLIDIGEHVHEAAKREIREECNLEIDSLGLLDVFEYIENQDDHVKYHFIVLDYFAKWKSGELKPGSDAPQARWFSVNDIKNMTIKPQLKNLIIKALKM